VKSYRIAVGLLLLVAATLAAVGVHEGVTTRTGEACTDFYAYANAAALANPIPEGQSRWSPRLAGRAENQRRLEALLEETAARPDAPEGSAERLAGDFYAACRAEARADAAGLEPLAPLLAEIDAAQTPADVQRALRRLHALGVPIGFTAAGAYSYRDPARFVPNIAAGNFGVRDAELDVYRKHVAALLALGGGIGAAEADAVVALETQLAEGALDPAAAGDAARTDHPTTFARLVEMAPAVDWAAYFDEAGLPRADLNVAEPRLLGQLDRALRETPVAEWRAYLRFQLLEAAAPYLSRRFVEESAAKGKPRARHCSETAEALIGDAVGRLYVKRYFPPADRHRVEAMVENLVATLKEDVAGLPWMAPETRARALAKLATYDAQVAAPHRWNAYPGLAIRRDALWANVAAARRFGVEEDRRRVGKPTDRDVWQLPASSSGAYIDAQLNQIVLPAGFLLTVGYRPDADDPELYGGIGAGVAHDLTHALDAGGAGFDAHGRPARWWSDADRTRFEARAACVDDAYGAFEVEPGLHLDGKRVESEAVGDLGGVRVAYRALAKALVANPAPAKDGATAEQRFFIAWARARFEAMRPEAERAMAKGDPHAPGRFRVLGTLAHLPEFQEAFACRADAKMVRPPDRRCAVW
jgi:endothelin-converting enzyme/putative endopeptidase